jgi:hypothetical protein
MRNVIFIVAVICLAVAGIVATMPTPNCSVRTQTHTEQFKNGSFNLLKYQVNTSVGYSDSDFNGLFIPFESPPFLKEGYIIEFNFPFAVHSKGWLYFKENNSDVYIRHKYIRRDRGQIRFRYNGLYPTKYTHFKIVGMPNMK